jgi:catechol-2,3-dioxygenase
MASPKKLAHIALATSDLARMRDWYCSVLEARVVFENEMLCFTTYDDEHHRVVFAKLPGFEAKPGDTRHLHHFSFTYATLDELLATYERLRDEDIRPWWTIHHGPTLSMYYRDPEGNNVELQIDTMTMPQALEFIRGGAFAKNPIGIPFDPETLIARHRAGESTAELLRYGG